MSRLVQCAECGTSESSDYFCGACTADTAEALRQRNDELEKAVNDLLSAWEEMREQSAVRIEPYDPFTAALVTAYAAVGR